MVKTCGKEHICARKSHVCGKHLQDCNCSFRIKDSDYVEQDVSVFKLIVPVLVK